MKVTVNGKTQDYNQSHLILIELLKLNNVLKPELVAVQLNGAFVNRESYQQTTIKDNDEVEFLFFMGEENVAAILKISSFPDNGSIPVNPYFAFTYCTLLFSIMGFTTKLIHSGFNKPDRHNAKLMPIYSNAAFEFDSAEQMESAFQGYSPDHIYSRISNPTVENLEKRIISITGAQSVTAVSSGMAAISNAFITLSEAGNNIITSNHLFGNTFSLFTSTLRSLNVEFRLCDLTDHSDVRKNIDKRCCRQKRKLTN